MGHMHHTNMGIKKIPKHCQGGHALFTYPYFPVRAHDGVTLTIGVLVIMGAFKFGWVMPPYLELATTNGCSRSGLSTYDNFN